MSFAFKIKYTVHHVFEYLRSGDAAFLIDVADDHNGAVVRLCAVDQLHRAFAYLRYAPGDRGRFRRIERLDRVDYHYLGIHSVVFGNDRVEVCLCEDQRVFAERVQAFRPHAKLSATRRDFRKILLRW